MKCIRCIIFYLLTIAIFLFYIESDLLAKEADTIVKLETNMGNILVKLDRRKAPITTDNFLQYVHSGFYDGTIFHRVIKGFIIQGGGLTADLKEKQCRASIHNEANNGLRNQKYTIAMARTSDPHSATSQFFINTSNNSALDFKDKDRNWGYAVFGMVISGKEVVDKIERVGTASRRYYDDVPISPVIIIKASLYNANETN